MSDSLLVEGWGEGGVRGQITLVADAKATKGLPEVLATPEEDMPVEKIEKGGVRWWWILVGVAVAGGIVAVVGGSKSDNTSNSSSSGGGSTGTTTVTW